MKTYRVTVMVAESCVITSSQDLDIFQIIVHCHNEILAEEIALQIVEEQCPYLEALSIEVEPMFN
jgi:hypothetical protein